MNRLEFRRVLRRELARDMQVSTNTPAASGTARKAPSGSSSGDPSRTSGDAAPLPKSPSYRPPAKLIDLTCVPSGMERDWGKSRG